MCRFLVSYSRPDDPTFTMISLVLPSRLLCRSCMVCVPSTNTSSGYHPHAHRCCVMMYPFVWRSKRWSSLCGFSPVAWKVPLPSTAFCFYTSPPSWAHVSQMSRLTSSFGNALIAVVPCVAFVLLASTAPTPREEHDQGGGHAHAEANRLPDRPPWRRQRRR